MRCRFCLEDAEWIVHAPQWRHCGYGIVVHNTPGELTQTTGVAPQSLTLWPGPVWSSNPKDNELCTADRREVSSLYG